MSTTDIDDEKLLAETEKSDERIVLATLAPGGAIPADSADRVRERARRIRERVFKEHGLLDIAVPAIRAFRDR
jgi:hypothetical protein